MPLIAINIDAVFDAGDDGYDQHQLRSAITNALAHVGTDVVDVLLEDRD